MDRTQTGALASGISIIQDLWNRNFLNPTGRESISREDFISQIQDSFYQDTQAQMRFNGNFDDYLTATGVTGMFEIRDWATEIGMDNQLISAIMPSLEEAYYNGGGLAGLEALHSSWGDQLADQQEDQENAWNARRRGGGRKTVTGTTRS